MQIKRTIPRAFLSCVLALTVINARSLGPVARAIRTSGLPDQPQAFNT